MLIKTQGIILKQRSIGEHDRIVTILTKDHGILEASAKGAKKMKSQLAGATQILCYSEFCIFLGKNYNSINSAQLIHAFYQLRLDVTKLSLAAYFCDLTNFLSPVGEGSWVYLRLLLNTLSFLESEKRSYAQLKCIFELRCLSQAGFMPDLVCCGECRKYEDETMFFLPVEAKLLCADCCNKHSVPLKYIVTPPILHAMRHIIYSDDDKLFRFQLTGKSLEQLAFIAENYMLIHTDSRFQSLHLYKQMHLT